MKSQTTERFRSLFAAAPAERQIRIRAAYQRWQANPSHPSLRFKKVHSHLPIYSVRVDVSRFTVSQWLHEHCGLSPDMALRLASLTGTTAESWLRTQEAMDL